VLFFAIFVFGVAGISVGLASTLVADGCFTDGGRDVTFGPVQDAGRGGGGGGTEPTPALAWTSITVNHTLWYSSALGN